MSLTTREQVGIALAKAIYFHQTRGVLSGDFDPSLSPEICLKNILKHTENGSVVVFHDSLKAWDRLEFALPKALEVWKKEGFEFRLL